MENDNTATLNRYLLNAWAAEARARPGTALGLLLAASAMLWLLFTSGYTALHGEIADRLGYAMAGGATGFAATAFGALAGDKGVGTFGGSEDHTAILCCRPATLSQYRFAPVQFERDLPMPDGYAFVVAFSGVLAEKTVAALETYNRASRAAARVLEIWRAASGRQVSTLEAAVSDETGSADAIRRAHPRFVENLRALGAAVEWR